MLDTNNTSNWKVGVAACVIFVFMCAGCIFMVFRDRVYKAEDCVLVRPLEVVSGHIEPPGTMYYVLYRGTTKEAGEVCVESVMVTESEYERMIYGEERLDLNVQN